MFVCIYICVSVATRVCVYESTSERDIEEESVRIL